MAAEKMKSSIGGGQAKIYLRPIQYTLNTMPETPEENHSKLQQKCKSCLKDILVKDLREHLRKVCTRR